MEEEDELEDDVHEDDPKGIPFTPVSKKGEVSDYNTRRSVKLRHSHCGVVVYQQIAPIVT